MRSATKFENIVYRISVKREKKMNSNPAGMFSNHLHDNVPEGDVIPISAPVGVFILTNDSQLPIVLISGGVGITSLLCLNEQVNKKK